MYNRILSKKELGEVFSVAPDANFAPMDLARKVWEILQVETEDLQDAEQSVQNGVPIFRIHVKHIARRIAGEPSPNMVGRIIHDMGLDDYRVRDGYLVIYNQDQLKILARVLEVVQ
jgi:hypothetical protein